MHTVISYQNKNACSKSGVNLLLHLLSVFYDSMRPAGASGLLDFKRRTKANMLMVAGQEFLGQKGWGKTLKADDEKENEGCNHHDLAQHGKDVKLKS